MRLYTITIQIEAENAGTNGSMPTQRKIKDHILNSISLGAIDGMKMKLKGMKILAIGSCEGSIANPKNLNWE